jgi:hypothetical protein
MQTENEKTEKYQDLRIELERPWEVPSEQFPRN